MKTKTITLICYGLALILTLSGVLDMLSPQLFGEVVNSTPTPAGVVSTPVPGAPLISADAFLNPPLENRPYRMVHSWLENMNNNKAKTTDEKLDFLLDIGYGGIVTNVDWNANYLQSDKDFDKLNDVLSKAASKGMGTWLYDEYRFPSGSAFKLTLEGHPEYEAIGLGEVSVSGKGKTTASLTIPADMKTVVAAFIYPVKDGIADITAGTAVAININGGKLTAQGIDGDWIFKAYGVYPVFVDGVYIDSTSAKRKYPNLLNKDAVARFIEVTYQQYKNKIPNFAEQIQAFFYDEPALVAQRFTDAAFTALDYPLVPWEGTLTQKFKSTYGYDLLDYLPSLFSGSSDTDLQVRQNYYELVGTMMKENFTGQIAKWCSDNSTVSSGHLLCEESMGCQIPLYGDFMETMSGMGYPGVDILNMMPEQFISSGLLMTTKMAQSVARNQNIDTVMAEICPVADEENFLKNHHEYALGSVGQLYLNGINQINEYYMPERTSLEEARIFNTYVARMDAFMEGSRQNNSIGIFYPTKTAQQYQLPSQTQDIYDTTKAVIDIDSAVKNIMSQLTNAKLDYSLLIEDYIDNGTVQNGYLKIGENKYTVIILPSVQVIPLKTMQKLDEFARGGGQLIFLNSLPTKSNLKSENAQVKTLAQKYRDNLISSNPVGNFENLALNAKVTASDTDNSGNGIYQATNITDGNQDTNNWSTSWAGSAPGWVELDLGKEVTLNTIVLYTQTGYELSSYSIQYKDGNVWKDIAKMAINSKNMVIHPFTAVTARYLRINALKGSAVQPNLARIIEVEVYNAEKTNSKSLLQRVTESCNLKLKLTEKNTADANKLMLGEFIKNNRKFYMVVNSSAMAVPFTLEEAGAKSFTIYNPYDGSITTTTQDVTLPGYRALYIEPNFG